MNVYRVIPDYIQYILLPIPFTALPKAWVCGHSLTEIAGLNPAGGIDVCLL
jgi:hypothetical protein